jgi:hypothetical protein
MVDMAPRAYINWAALATPLTAVIDTTQARAMNHIIFLRMLIS